MKTWNYSFAAALTTKDSQLCPAVLPHLIPVTHWPFLGNACPCVRLNQRKKRKQVEKGNKNMCAQISSVKSPGFTNFRAKCKAVQGTRKACRGIHLPKSLPDHQEPRFIYRLAAVAEGPRPVERRWLQMLAQSPWCSMARFTRRDSPEMLTSRHCRSLLLKL